MASFDTDNQLALSALIVALVALLSTLLQLLQQYFATAEGYRRCGPSVLGEWARFTRRRFKFRELRFETVFATPVISLSWPDRADELGQVLLDSVCFPGTAEVEAEKPQSRRDSSKPPAAIKSASVSLLKWITPLSVPAAVSGKKDVQSRIVDAAAAKSSDKVENEFASWIPFIDLLCMYSRREWKSEGNYGYDYLRFHRPIVPAVRASVKSWDFMPAEITRPYAMTTVSEIAALALMLGMEWIEFNPEEGRLHARSPVHLITSYHVRCLGTVIHFSSSHPAFEYPFYFRGAFEAWTLGFGCIPMYLSSLYNSRWHPPLFPVSTADNIRKAMQVLSRVHGSHVLIPELCHDNVLSIIATDLMGMLANLMPITSLMDPIRFANKRRNIILKPSKLFDYCDTLQLDDFHNELLKCRREYPEPGRHQIRVLNGILDHCRKLNDVVSEPERNHAIPGRRPEEVRSAFIRAFEEMESFLMQDGVQRMAWKVLIEHVNMVVHNLSDMSEMDDVSMPDSTDLMRRYFQIRKSMVEAHKADPEWTNASTIWVCLVFRCLCWHHLHEFMAKPSSVPLRYLNDESPIYIE